MLHETAALADLAVGELVLLALVGILAGAELDDQRAALQLQCLAEAADEKTLVACRDGLGLVAVDDDARRVLAALVGVAQLDAAAARQRRCVLGDAVLEDFCQAAGLELADGVGIGMLHVLEPKNRVRDQFSLTDDSAGRILGNIDL